MKQKRKVKCSDCNRRVEIYRDPVTESWHLHVHDWRGGERCIGSYKRVYGIEEQP